MPNEFTYPLLLRKFMTTQSAPETTSETSAAPESTSESTTTAAPETTSESTTAAPETTSESAPAPATTQTGVTMSEVLELLKVLQTNQPAAPVTPEAPAPATPEQPKDDANAAAIHALLIKVNKVPEELQALLPTDVNQLVTYLSSPGYTAAAAKLNAAAHIQPPTTQTPEPKTAPKDKVVEPKAAKTFAEIDSAALSAFDKLYS